MINRRAPEHEEMAGLLAYYEVGKLSDENRTALEAHLLECDECFAELERGSAVFAAIRGSRPRMLKALEEAPASGARAGGEGPLVRIGEFFQGMRKPLLAAAVLGILIAAGTFWQLGRRMDYSRLATFPREETTSSLVRGPRLSDTVRELMETGAGYFETERYAEADRYFRAVLDRDSTVAQAAYFLGLCRIFSGDAASAVPHLERASRMAGDELRSGALWVLANAYLKAKSLAKARGVLEDLATGRNEYAVKAQHLLGRLPR